MFDPCPVVKLLCKTRNSPAGLFHNICTTFCGFTQNIRSQTKLGNGFDEQHNSQGKQQQWKWMNFTARSEANAFFGCWPQHCSIIFRSAQNRLDQGFEAYKLFCRSGKGLSFGYEWTEIESFNSSLCSRQISEKLWLLFRLWNPGGNSNQHKPLIERLHSSTMTLKFRKAQNFKFKSNEKRFETWNWWAWKDIASVEKDLLWLCNRFSLRVHLCTLFSNYFWNSTALCKINNNVCENKTKDRNFPQR